MDSKDIQPEKITKPIQLLAAWLVGLILVNGSFLTAASQLTVPSWLPPLLVIASIVNVPLFLVSLFLLQTKFRPEMQEDTFYSKYLEKRYQSNDIDDNQLVHKEDLEKTAKLIVEEVNKNKGASKTKIVESILQEKNIEYTKINIQHSRALSELFLYPEKWSEFVDRWKNDKSFNNDILRLRLNGAIDGKEDDLYSISLTDIGRSIAASLKDEEALWNQKHKINSRHD
nr:MAG TPA: hypothetical protein [Caudoviricetes sp.]